MHRIIRSIESFHSLFIEMWWIFQSCHINDAYPLHIIIIVRVFTQEIQQAQMIIPSESAIIFFRKCIRHINSWCYFSAHANSSSFCFNFCIVSSNSCVAKDFIIFVNGGQNFSLYQNGNAFCSGLRGSTKFDLSIWWKRFRRRAKMLNISSIESVRNSTSFIIWVHHGNRMHEWNCVMILAEIGKINK